MSETTTRRRIRAQALPRDPHTMRFILDAPVQVGRAARFDDHQTEAPLPKALFGIDGVQTVQVTGETILVTRTETGDWHKMKPEIAAVIREVLDASDEPLGDGSETATEAGDAAILAAVTEILDRQANPSIASHGGHITAEAVEDGIVYLRMSGGCQGCAASSRTLRDGVETMLRAGLPQIRKIVDVTDHASGTNPFYRGKAGSGPAFIRPVPADVLAFENGEVAIDPDFLAPKLGLTPEDLMDGLASGDVVVSSEVGKGKQAGDIRVAVYGPQRAWAARILPGGGAHEIPPPRRTEADIGGVKSDLPGRVRRYLVSLRPDDVPVTYGQLARTLGFYLPGSIRKITAALEATMQEDAKAARPFIAARAIGRGTGRMPGKGFFDLARALGRGPEPDESDAEFHRRQLADGLKSD